MTAARRALDRVLAVTLIVLMGGAVLNVWWQVFTRWVLQDPSSYTEELARYLLVWIGTLGAAYGVGRKIHLAIDLVPTALKGRSRYRLEILIQILISLFAFAVMVVGGTRLVALTFQFEQYSAAMGVPLGVVYAVIPLSGIIVMFYSALDVVTQVRALRGDETDVVEPERSTTRPID